jgi:hypothetical protein
MARKTKSKSTEKTNGAFEDQALKFVITTRKGGHDQLLVSAIVDGIGMDRDIGSKVKDTTFPLVVREGTTDDLMDTLAAIREDLQTQYNAWDIAQATGKPVIKKAASANARKTKATSKPAAALKDEDKEEEDEPEDAGAEEREEEDETTSGDDLDDAEDDSADDDEDDDSEDEVEEDEPAEKTAGKKKSKTQAKADPGQNSLFDDL